VGDLRAWRGGVGLIGPAPIDELLEWLDQPEQRRVSDYWLDAVRAHALAMLDRTDEARTIMADTRAALADRGAVFELAIFTGDQSAEIELLAGEPAAAADMLSHACRELETLGDHYHRPAMVARLAHVLSTLGRFDEANELVERIGHLDASDDVGVQIRLRQARALTLASRGRHHEAKELARAAVAMADTTDLLNDQADTYVDLAEVLALGGEPNEAAEALQEALHRYDRKGNVVMSRRVRVRLTSTSAPSDQIAPS
jgi:tetratricopeptide (TPR) repeat protein